VRDLRQAFFRFYSAAAHAVNLSEQGDPAAAQQFIAHGDYQEGSRRMKRLLVELEQRRLRDGANSAAQLRGAAA
jgi:hypothetical protein